MPPDIINETKEWEITNAEDHWLEVKDPEGWYSAVVKWDGCVHYTRYSNEPLSEDENNQDYLHICDLQSEIDRLYALLQVARKHYKDHHYYDEAFAKQPNIIANIGRELEARCEGERKQFVPADQVWEGDEDYNVGEWKLVPKEDGLYCLNCGRFTPEEGCHCGLWSLDRTLTIIRSITGISPTR